MAAIETATTNAAQLLNQESVTGRITAGTGADIIALTSSPLDDIAAVEPVVFVMKDGQIFRSPDAQK